MFCHLGLTSFLCAIILNYSGLLNCIKIVNDNYRLTIGLHTWCYEFDATAICIILCF